MVDSYILACLCSLEGCFYFILVACIVCFLFQLITAKLVHVGNSMPSSPDSSSDSSGGSPHHTYDGPNIEAENCLPGVVSKVTKHYKSEN